MQDVTVREVIEDVRGKLRERRGRYRELSAAIDKRKKPTVTYRWIVAFANGQDREPAFSRVLELSAALGLSYRIVR